MISCYNYRLIVKNITSQLSFLTKNRSFLILFRMVLRKGCFLIFPFRISLNMKICNRFQEMNIPLSLSLN